MLYHITEILKNGQKLYWGSIINNGTFEESCAIFFNNKHKTKKLIQEKK